ncbi:hypothetical protein OAP25_03200 [Flavobacteriaceae bacterium]|nr:hypothetical protein [Flavobacteriaceae bacterium]
MKLQFLILALILWTTTPMGAQNNETVKEVVTVKRVVVNNGSKVIVTEEKALTTESGTVVVQGNLVENQNMTEQIVVKTDSTAQVKQAYQDSINQAQVLALKEQRALELKASIEAQKAKAEAQKRVLEAQYKARMKALIDQKKMLERKPDN